MRAVQLTRFGGPEVLDVVDLPDGPRDGEQPYDVSATGISYADTTGCLDVWSRRQTAGAV